MGIQGQGLTIKTLRVKRDSTSRDPQGQLTWLWPLKTMPQCFYFTQS